MNADRVLLGVADGFGASMKGPGHVHHSAMNLIRVGEMNGGMTDRLQRITGVWQEAGFNAKGLRGHRSTDLGQVHLQRHPQRPLHRVRSYSWRIDG